MRFIETTLWEQQRARRHGPPIATMIHGTGGPGIALPWIKRSGVNRSYHQEIHGDRVYVGVGWMYAAYHAGEGEILHNGESVPWVNDLTIGIAIGNHLRVIERDGDFFFRSGGELHPYRGKDPVKARLEFDDGVSVEGWWEPYSDDSIQTLVLQLEGLQKGRYAQAGRAVIGHEDTAIVRPVTERKTDPGPLFPWDALPAQRLNPRTKGVLL